MRILLVYVELPETYGPDAAIERSIWFEEHQSPGRRPETHAEGWKDLMAKLENEHDVVIDQSEIGFERDKTSMVDTYELLFHPGKPLELEKSARVLNLVYESVKDWYQGKSSSPG